MGYTHEKRVVRQEPATTGGKAVVMLHGRGSTAESILSLRQHLNLGSDALLLAPQATNNSWYPHSFMAPTAQNQPALDSAVELVGEAVREAVDAGIAHEQIYFVGFSQGACLALEYVARHAKRYGGVVAFTGGLVGGALDTASYQGAFGDTPILVSAGDQDPHVPLGRIRESETVLAGLDAAVTVDIYPGKPHSISMEEIERANALVFHR